MADNSDLQKIQASEKPTSDDFEYAYVETVNKAFVRIAKERLKEILGANRYTNEEIDQKLSTIPKFNIEVVSSLPTTDISETTIYLVSSGDDSENLYTEYININGLWEILGTQKSTFSGSAKDVTYDDTETKLGATNVQDAFGKLSATINNLPSGKNVKTILENIMTIMKAQVDFEGRPQAYSPDISDIASQTDILIANLNSSDGEEPDTPENPTVTLSSISATYNGGEVATGTALSDLTGITVTATYSDGTTKTITGYELSGEIVEGENTITVSYGGKTATFKVTGIVEESGANETTAWDNASEYSFGAIMNNVRNAKATGTFAYQTISTEYIQMFNTGLGDNWNGIVIIDEEGEFTTNTNQFPLWFQYVNKEYGLRIHQTVGKSNIGATDSSNDDYYKIENGSYYAKSRLTSDGYQPFVVVHRYRWFAW